MAQERRNWLLASVLPNQGEIEGATPEWRAPMLRAARKTKPEVAGKFAVVALAFYTFFKMFYIFNEGVAQPADIMLAALALLIASPTLVLSFLKKQKALLLLLIWIAIVNFTWALITNKTNMAIPVSYYVFNVIVVITAYAVRSRSPLLFDKYMIIALRLSIIVQFIFVLIDPNFRPLGTFQNPNQLAYWGIVVLSIYLVIRRNESYWSDMPFLIIVTYCVVASLSRAGAAAAILMLAAWFWLILRTQFRRLVGVVFGFMLVIGAYQTGYIDRFLEQSTTAEDFERRQGGNASSLAEERNYDRITEFYQYTILGAGEGFNARWEPSTIVAIEIHSSFGTMLFSYGIVGLLLFCAFLYRVMRALPLSLGLYLLPSLVYGITHQGLRFSFFWVLIGIMIALGEQLDYRKTSKPVARTPAAATVLGTRVPRGPEQLRGLASDTPSRVR
jgi:O-Antigen ligase